MDLWLEEAKSSADSEKCGMYLFHNGVVREDAKAKVRENAGDTLPVRGMLFSYDSDKVSDAEKSTLKMEGIFYVRTWLNSGKLNTGDDIMLVLIGGDIRPHVVDALQYLVGRIKNECVTETEIY